MTVMDAALPVVGLERTALTIDALGAAVAECVRLAGGPSTAQLIWLRRKADVVTAQYRVGDGDTATVTSNFARAGARSPLDSVTGRWPATIEAHEGALRIEVFPHDSELPALSSVLADPTPVLPHSGAEVVRYKPGSRCVVRIDDGERMRYAKLYRTAAQAHSAWRIAGLLVDDPGMRPHVAPMVAILPELCAVVTEAVAGVAGKRALRPPRPSPGSALRGAEVPDAELWAAGAALARLHAVLIPTGLTLAADHTAERTAARGAELAAFHPFRAPRIDRCTALLLSALAAQTGPTRLGHGAFKPSQLLVTGSKVVITDFDGVDQADPARDLGYFLGYLRPSHLWHGVDGARSWFTRAAESVVNGYADAAVPSGRERGEVAETLARTGPYEAVALLKRAVRRAHRVNGPRDGEVAAILTEIDSVLTGQGVAP